MLTIDNHTLEMRFPDVHPDAVCCISLHREDPLKRPSIFPWLNTDQIPLFPLDDYANSLPAPWVKRGGVLAPVRSGEHIRIEMHGRYSFALKVASGKINAITGTPWSDTLNLNHQDYVVTSYQRMLSGFCQPDGTIRQFVVSPMGLGTTVEERTTGSGEFGGIQLLGVPQKAVIYDEERRRPLFSKNIVQEKVTEYAASLSLDAGKVVDGRIKKDENTAQWSVHHFARCFVHLLSEEDFLRLTGRRINGRKASPVSLAYWRHRTRP